MNNTDEIQTRLNMVKGVKPEKHVKYDTHDQYQIKTKQQIVTRRLKQIIEIKIKNISSLDKSDLEFIENVLSDSEKMDIIRLYDYVLTVLSDNLKAV